jgi:predicted transcriptional regulator
VSLSLRLRPEVVEAMRVAADERDLPLNWLAERAFEDYLARLIPADELKLTKD